MNDTTRVCNSKIEGTFDGLQQFHYDRMAIQKNNNQTYLPLFSENSGGQNFFQRPQKNETANYETANKKNETAI